MMRASVRSADGVRVWAAGSQEAAFEEACRRLKIMHQKWPETRWHMSVRKDRRNRYGLPSHLFWAVYCRVLPDAD